MTPKSVPVASPRMSPPASPGISPLKQVALKREVPNENFQTCSKINMRLLSKATKDVGSFFGIENRNENRPDSRAASRRRAVIAARFHVAREDRARDIRRLERREVRSATDRTRQSSDQQPARAPRGCQEGDGERPEPLMMRKEPYHPHPNHYP